MSRQAEIEKTSDNIKKLAADLTNKGVFPDTRAAQERITRAVVRSEQKSKKENR